MASAEIVKTFLAGDDVPEWLLVARPMGEDSKQEAFRFAVDCHAIRTSGMVIVIPDSVIGTPIMEFKGTGMSIAAEWLRVLVPDAFTVFDAPAVQDDRVQ